MQSNLNRTAKRLMASGAAIALALSSASPAFATIDNTVTVTGTPAAGSFAGPITADENVDVIDKTTGVNLVKSAAAPTVALGASGAFTDAGDTITYTYTVTNTGNVSLGAVAINDPGPTFNSQPLAGTWTAPTLQSGDTDSDNRLDPTETWIYATTYALAQGDITNALGVANGVSNTASISAEDPDNVPVATPPVCATCTATTTINGAPAMTVAKVGTFDLGGGAGVQTADGTTDEVPVNTVITYTYTITNTGPVPIANVALADNHLGDGTDPVPDADTATLTNNGGGSSNTTNGDGVYDLLGPGDVLTVTATYTVIQDDIDNHQ